VLDGLKPGETIVVNGLQRVRPGSPVTPERVAMGERERSDKPQTLFAHNTKLAANADAGNAVATSSNTASSVDDAAWLGTPPSATKAASAGSVGGSTSKAQQGAPAASAPIAKPAAKPDSRHSSHVALNTTDAPRPNADAASSND
jgi:hypothetical protein